MSTLQALTDAERTYDYCIPDAVREGIRHGSHLDSMIASHTANVRFYREMLVQARRSSRAWLLRGNREMAESNRRDGWIYLTGWRTARKSLALLEAEKRVNGGTLKTLSAIGAMLGRV